jgi:arylsulfatase A-like enzyme
MVKTPDNGQFDSVYAAMIESLDQSVGSLIVSLERTGQSDNTILIFFSDNGTAPFVAPEEPFRGYKGTLYEGGIRVPLIIQLPQDEGGKTIDTPVIGTDLYPTILDLAGIEKPEDYPIDGVSLKPLFEHSDEFQQRALFWHFPAYLQGEYGMTEIWRTTPVSAVRKGNFKLLEFHEDGHKELYNLKDDPAETINLVRTEQAIAEKLIDLLVQWRLTHGVPFPLEKNPEYDAASIPEYYKSEERSAVYIPGFK